MTSSDPNIRDFFKLLDKIVDEAVLKYPNDVDAAVEYIEPLAGKLPGLQTFTRTLLRQAFRERAHWRRSSLNEQLRNKIGKPRSRPKVIAMNSEEGAAASERRSLYDYFISGMRLGDVTGAMIPDIMSHEAAVSTTASFHVRVLAECQPSTPADKTIQESVKESKLNRIFEKAAKEVGLNRGDAA